jgi:amidohydrolase
VAKLNDFICQFYLIYCSNYAIFDKNNYRWCLKVILGVLLFALDIKMKVLIGEPMPTKDELKAMLSKEIDRRRDEIIQTALAILDHPETGFREIKTSRRVFGKFSELGLAPKEGLALTGVKGQLNGAGEGPSVAILGELDALIVPDHLKADKKTGAAHACGHHAQIGQLIAVAVGFTHSGIMPNLSGKVVFMAVPAEEYIEIKFRNGLRQEGRISFLAGKQELIRLGEFDDIDLAMMTHNHSIPGGKKLGIGGTSNGMLAKQIQFLGLGAHAGAAPHLGVNALNAAMIALSAIHTQRETFRDKDAIRVHPIITKGGESVNIVPSDVRMETYVRGKTLEAIQKAGEKVDRCLRAGALAVGGRVRIQTLPGYSPMMNDPWLQEVYKENALSLVGEEEVGLTKGHTGGSTDMGDISQIMPAVHPYAGGAAGIAHGKDFMITDYELGLIIPAKAMAMTVIDLLADGAAKGKEILAKSTPPFTKEKYLALMESLLKEEEYEG